MESNLNYEIFFLHNYKFFYMENGLWNKCILECKSTLLMTFNKSHSLNIKWNRKCMIAWLF